MDVFYILKSASKKTPQMSFINWFFAMCSADPVGAIGEFLFRISLWDFLSFQELNLFICHCSFITLAQNTIVRVQMVRF